MPLGGKCREVGLGQSLPTTEREPGTEQGAGLPLGHGHFLSASLLLWPGAELLLLGDRSA